MIKFITIIIFSFILKYLINPKNIKNIKTKFKQRQDILRDTFMNSIDDSVLSNLKTEEEKSKFQIDQINNMPDEEKKEYFKMKNYSTDFEECFNRLKKLKISDQLVYEECQKDQQSNESQFIIQNSRLNQVNEYGKQISIQNTFLGKLNNKMTKLQSQCESNYLKTQLSTMRGANKGFQSSLLEQKINPSGLINQTLLDLIKDNDNPQVNAHAFEMHILSQFRDTLTWQILSIMVMQTVFWCCLDNFQCKRQIFWCCIRPVLESRKASTNTLLQERFQILQQGETFFNKFIPTLEVSMQPKRVQGWVLLLWVLLLAAFSQKLALKVNSLQYNLNYKCASYSAPMEIMQGHDTWNWKGTYNLRADLKDQNTFLKQKHTQIQEIFNFLDDPDTLRQNWFKENINLISSLETHELKIGTLREQSKVVKEFFINRKLIDSNQDLFEGNEMQDNINTLEDNNDIIQAICEAVVKEFNNSNIKEFIDQNKSVEEFKRIYQQINQPLSCQPDMLFSKFINFYQDKQWIDPFESLINLITNQNLQTFTFKLPKNNDQFQVNKNLLKLCTFWLIKAKDRVLDKDNDCLNLFGDVNSSCADPSQSTKGVLQSKSRDILHCNSTNHCQIDLQNHRYIKFCDQVWFDGQNKLRVYKTQPTDQDNDYLNYKQLHEIFGNLQSNNLNDRHNSKKYFDFIEDMQFQFHIKDFKNQLYPESSIATQNGILNDAQQCTDYRLYKKDNVPEGNQLYLFEFKDVQVPTFAEAIKFSQDKQADYLPEQSTNLTQRFLKIFKEFDHNLRDYRIALKENITLISRQLDSIKEKVDLLRNADSVLLEVNGSLDTLNEGFNVSILALEQYEAFFLWVDSLLELGVILVLVQVLQILNSLACACATCEDFCCCFCCTLELRWFFEWLDNKLNNRLISNVDQIVEKRKTVWLKFYFDYIWKSLFLVTFVLGLVCYWYFFNWHFKGELCEVSSYYHYHNRAHEFFSGDTKEFLHYCLYSDQAHKELKNLLPIDTEGDVLDQLIETIDRNKSTLLHPKDQFDWLDVNYFKPDMELLLDKSQQEQMQNLENLNLDIPEELKENQFGMVRKLITTNNQSQMDFIDSREQQVTRDDFHQLKEKEGVSGQQESIDMVQSVDDEVLQQLSGLHLDEHSDYTAASSETNLYSALVSINDMTNHSQKIEDIVFDSVSNKYQPLPHATPLNPRSIQYSQCNKQLALRDHWVVQEAQCQDYCAHILALYSGIKSTSGHKAMCTVNNLSTDGDKDNSAAGFNCQSIDRMYDIKSYVSRQTGYFLEFQGCQALGQGALDSSQQIEYQDQVSSMIEVVISIFKQGNQFYTPLNDTMFTNNLKLINGLTEGVMKSIFEKNALQMYKLNLEMSIINKHVYKLLQELKFKRDSLEYVERYDCSFVKSYFEDFIKDMCGPNKAHNMIIYYLNQFILSLIVCLSLLVREAVRVWRTEDEIRNDEYDWDK